MLGFNRWHLLKGLAAILCIGGIVSLALIYFFPAPPTTFKIATGLKGGAFDQFANSYREKLARRHVNLELHPTANSSANLKPVEDPSSGVDAAFLFSGLTNSTQSPGLMSLGRVGYNPIWIFYRGTETLDRLAQLKGKRIGLLPTLRVTNQILAANGVTPDNSTMLPRVGPAAAKALRDGEVDAKHSFPQRCIGPIGGFDYRAVGCGQCRCWVINGQTVAGQNWPMSALVQ